MKFLHDYTLNDSLGDYNSLEKFHKKLMALRKKHKKGSKMSQVINVKIVYCKTVIVEDTGQKDTKRYESDCSITIPAKGWKKALVKEFEDILDNHTNIESIYISI